MSAMAGGVTIITHGFQPEGSQAWPMKWVDSMADQIALQAYNRGAFVSIWEYDPGQQMFIHRGSTSPSADPKAALEQMVLKFNWAEDSNDPGGGFAEAAGEALFAALMRGSELPDRTPVSFVEMPLHFIGHSRGAVVNSEAVKRLGILGVNVDHVTTLDPHPAAGANQDTRVGVHTWTNIAFADNYWREGEILSPNGDPIPGAFDRELVEDHLEAGGYGALTGGAHANVHLWYHGTIDLSLPFSDGKETVSNDDWYLAPNGPRGLIGFFFSRIMGGDRDGLGQDGLKGSSANPFRESLPAQSKWVVNGDFNYSAGLQFDVAGFRYHGGQNAAIVDTMLDAATLTGAINVLRHNVLFIPKMSGSAALTFRLKTQQVIPGPAQLVVSFLSHELASIPLTDSLDWVAQSISLDSFAGQAGLLEFELKDQSLMGTDLHLDDIAITGAPVPWANIQLKPLAKSIYAAGGAMTVEWDLDNGFTTPDSTVDLIWDTDRNPYNGFISIAAAGLSSTTGQATFTVADLLAGAYHLYARIGDPTGTFKRYDFLPQAIAIDASPELTAGLVAYYPFEGGSRDASGNGHDARADGAILATDAAGRRAGAYAFDGIDDRLWINSHQHFEFTQNFTAAAWVKRTQPGRPMGDPILSKDDLQGTGRSEFLFRFESSLNSGADRLAFWWWNSGWHGGALGPEVQDTSWHHVAAVHTGSEVLLFLDGNPIGSLPVTAPLLAQNEPLLIGQGHGTPPSGTYFMGSIDEVRIYNRALSAAEVHVLALLGSPSPGFASVFEFPPSTTGASWCDVDGDGRLELFVNGYRGKESVLYRISAAGEFVVAQTFPAGHTTSSSWGDYDNDGRPDLLIVTLDQATRLYRNEGGGVLAEISPSPFPGLPLTSSGAWVDYDRDGNLDVSITTGIYLEALNSLLYRGDGHGGFHQVLGSPVVQDAGKSYGGVWADYDDNGWPDFLVLNNGLDHFYRNLGDGRFERVTEGMLVTDDAAHFGACWGDYDNNGLLELFVSVADPNQRNFLFHNEGGGILTRMTSDPIANSYGSSYAASWVDFDNDGDIDLFVVRGLSPNLLFRNDGHGRFSAVLDAALVSLPSAEYRGCAWGDYDNDGFMDMVIAADNAEGHLFRNRGNGNRWLKVRCVGMLSNGSAIGAKVRVKAVIWGQEVWQMREISAQSGAGGHDSQIAHFGLGDASQAEVVKVEWPSGIVQEVIAQAANQELTLVEPSALIAAQPQTHAASVGSTTSFTVVPTGGAGLTYQWRRDGVNLSDGERINGVSTPSLTISGVQADDVGDYTVVVSNASATITSEAARLIVEQPGHDNVPALVWIPAGSFTMGSPDNEEGRTQAEGPLTHVTISQGFYMGRCEVTQAEYEAVVGSNPSAFRGDPSLPVEQVSWTEATEYCALLTARERAEGRISANVEYRLPTEAQWEFACRSGTTTRLNFGDDPGYVLLSDHGWFADNSGSTTHPVGEKPANAWGLRDMHGNVWEWCSDWWTDSLPGGSVIDPTGPETGLVRPIRGGTYGNPPSLCRSAVRSAFQSSDRLHSVGFRVILASTATPCSFSGVPAELGIPSAGGQSTIALTASRADCEWTLSNGCGDWLAITPTSGTGNASIGVVATANTTGTTRSCTLTVAGQSVAVTQPPEPVPCVFSIDPATWAAPADGGTLQINITRTSGGIDCPWQATTPCDWVSATPANGAGTSTVITVPANQSGAQRSCTVIVGGHEVSIVQPALPPPDVTAIQSASSYQWTGTCTITGRITYPQGRQMLSLLWRPILPPGWQPTHPVGDGAPELRNGEIVWPGLIPASPVTFSFTAQVPSGESGPKALAGQVEFLLDGMVNPLTIRATPDPVMVLDCTFHTADYRDPRWFIDGTEANRPLSYWRAGGYHCDPLGADGYAPGAGDLICGRHDGDFREPFGRLDGTEINRILSYWRAGGYRCDPLGLDGYAPGIPPGGGGLLGGGGKGAKGGKEITHQGPTRYAAGQTITITNKFEYDGQMLSLLWRPQLPPSWTIQSVSGDGNPELQWAEIVWTGALPPSPITMFYVVQVPSAETGDKEIRAQVEYQAVGDINPTSVNAATNPLVLTDQPPPPTFSFVQSGPTNYQAGATLTITNRVEYEGTLISLLWRPVLPADWALQSVSGDGNPELQFGEILWTGTMPPSPIAMVYTVQVPSAATGIQEIRSQVEYQPSGVVNPIQVDAEPTSISLKPVPPAPAFEGIVRLENEEIEVRLRVRAGANYVVEATSDFQNWTPVASGQSADGLVVFRDTNPATRQSRYFRAGLFP